MKRTPELRILSEEHHHGLLQARRLRLTGEGGETRAAEPVARGFLEFWQKDASIHFRREEEVLLPVVARHGGDLSKEPLVNILEDHERVEEGLRGVLGHARGAALAAADAYRAWGERFFPVAPSRPTPVPTDRVLVAVEDLANVLDRFSPKAVQGTVARSGEVLLLAFDTPP